jgi:hypothetical protein
MRHNNYRYTYKMIEQYILMHNQLKEKNLEDGWFTFFTRK